MQTSANKHSQISAADVQSNGADYDNFADGPTMRAHYDDFADLPCGQFNYDIGKNSLLVNFRFATTF